MTVLVIMTWSGDSDSGTLDLCGIRLILLDLSVCTTKYGGNIWR